MRFSSRSKLSIALSLFALAAVVAGLVASGALRGTPSVAHAASAAGTHHTINCASAGTLCTEVNDSDWVFGENHYVGHDEPSDLFYSKVSGSGNQMRYELILPNDPAGNQPQKGKGWNFQLHPAFWFGMAMCDTQSYPEQL